MTNTETMGVDKVDGRIYEVSFLIDPKVPSESVSESVATVRQILESRGAHILSEGSPTTKTLAYTMIVSREGKNKKYSKAHFSWIKFEGTPETLDAINKALQLEVDIIRFIIVKTLADDNLTDPSRRMPEKEDEKESSQEEVAESEEELVNEEVLDEKIDELIV